MRQYLQIGLALLATLACAEDRIIGASAANGYISLASVCDKSLWTDRCVWVTCNYDPATRASWRAIDLSPLHRDFLQGIAGARPTFMGGGLNYDGNDFITQQVAAPIVHAGTVMAWVKPTNWSNISGDPDYYIAQVVSQAKDGGNDVALFFGDGTLAHRDNAAFYVLSPTGSILLLCPSDQSLSTWYHVAGTWDGVTAKLYVDGVLTNSGTMGQAADPATLDTWIIGANRYKTNSRPFYGSIDDVVVFRTQALAEASIKSEFARTAGARAK